MQLQDTSDLLRTGIVLLLAAVSTALIYARITARLRARNIVEGVLKALLILCSAFAIFTTIGIVLSVLFEAIRFFKIVPPHEFLFG
ncbi:MAG TPA: phosphate ABC transporter permease subunit PstC, partial [Desulfoprunum sp.]|nr:phosphate ABC transporter permease subunit PstC [Desulfoprunum sp.]